jgi:hypothetical protein
MIALRPVLLVIALFLSVAAFSQNKPTASDALTTEPYVIQTFDARKVDAELVRLRVK